MTHHYECPYCGAGHNDIDDIYKESVSHEMECPSCEKTYYVTVAYSADYSTHSGEVEQANIERQKAFNKSLREFKI